MEIKFTTGWGSFIWMIAMLSICNSAAIVISSFLYLIADKVK